MQSFPTYWLLFKPNISIDTMEKIINEIMKKYPEVAKSEFHASRLRDETNV